MNILVVGSGAIGSFYGSLLAKTGAKVSMVARSDHALIRAHGIDIRSDKLGNWHFQPKAVYRDIAEVLEKPDYILLCVKMLERIDLASLIRSAVRPDTAIVLIANGVGVEEQLAKAFPTHELISTLAFICVTRTAPGKIWHQDRGHLDLGLYPAGLSPKVKALSDVFNHAGIKTELRENIVTFRWFKNVWNASFNPLSVLSGGLDVAQILKVSEHLVRSVMQEIVNIAAATGCILPPDTVDLRVQQSYALPPYKTSMLVDFEAGRPMEIEAILGTPLQIARKAGISAPHLECLYALMKMRELSMTQRKI